MEKWIPFYIIFFVIYMQIIVNVTANMDYSVYDLTSDQEQALANINNDIGAMLNGFFVLTSVNSSYAFIGAITTVLIIIFILAIATAINEFIPFT